MISVCIATYNGEKYIKEQLESILSQLKEGDEVVISDDSSVDNTLKIIDEINDSRISLHINNKFYSPIFNLENALKKAKGDFILLSDQDDVWLPGKVECMLEHLEKYDLVVSDCNIIDENGIIIGESFFQIRNSGKGFWRNVYKNTYLGCCMGFRRNILNYALPFPRSTPMHDIWLGLIAEIFGRTFFINEKLIQYRRHGMNASFGGGNSGFSVFFQIKYRIITLIQIFFRIIKTILNKSNK